MNAEHLLQHFERISEAPDAIPRLRQFILNLAVRGKLEEQDPNDEPASELLKRIQAEKEQLAQVGKVKKEKGIQSRAKGVMPAELPKGWLWTSIQEVCTSVTDGDHLPPPKSEGGIPFLVIGNVRSKSIEFGGCRYVPESYYQQLDEIRRPRKGDVLYTLVGSYGIPIVVRDTRPFCVQRHISILRPSQYIDVDFLARVLESKVVFDQATQSATGIAQQTVPLAGLRGILIPLPPLAEQYRIVAKVDELMALCDQLEAVRTERDQSRDRLVVASLHRLNQPTDAAEADTPDSFRDHARFVFTHLPRLTTGPEHIKQLRQTILNLAIRGKLVPQDPNDEPTSGFLNRIDPDEEDFGPFALPDSWTWAKIKEIADMRLGKMLDKAKNKGIERRYLRNVNVRWFDFDLSDVLTMRFEDSELEEFSLRVGDVLICEGGEPGRSAVWDGREQNIYFQKAIHRVRFSQWVNPHYFVAVLKQSADSGRLAEYFTGVGIKHFTGKGLSSFLVPLPPVAEQHRIVAKVDELMGLCDQLEAQLTTSETDRRRLLEAVLHEVLAPALEETA